MVTAVNGVQFHSWPTPSTSATAELMMCGNGNQPAR